MGLKSALSGQHFRGEPRQQRHFGRIITKSLFLGDSLVVVAVDCEPVSILNSLLTGNFTGNLVVYAVEIEKVTEINASFQVDTKKFPTQRNREFT
jgi:hypothetical protein